MGHSTDLKSSCVSLRSARSARGMQHMGTATHVAAPPVMSPVPETAPVPTATAASVCCCEWKRKAEHRQLTMLSGSAASLPMNTCTRCCCCSGAPLAPLLST